ncbi:sulfotransferase family 2 domain-containing protein [sulfur-oxidizing endosymbiont of Gigantopelta aegis]|uniref:sulfotransferase family 2 domain-containing protein n=1 Tax=sulfur-oxidizing endosymbiont of Gigantopelta aegis TaxID=2794934 RepID=UPI0018DEAC51|nr:sulfotransferase family 2 domain-containing protein [sulfur-oxidizing endosymbiont of Gigantopelta aegis]
MLISHRKKFIFTKTVKTAGTSIESYFEKYCMPDGDWHELHARDEYISETGIIGHRGSREDDSIWYNHMSAEKIRDLLGRETWDSYFKFTVVRNPFDKLISGFFMFENRKENYNSIRRFRAFVKKTLDRGGAIDRISGNTEVERFRCWIRKGGKIIDRDKYLIDGEYCINYFIRFENLHKGVRDVCNDLSIPFEPSRIPEFKKGIRHHNVKIQDYYDNETEQIVRNLYALEIEKFGYDLLR